VAYTFFSRQEHTSELGEKILYCRAYMSAVFLSFVTVVFCRDLAHGGFQGPWFKKVAFYTV